MLIAYCGPDLPFPRAHGRLLCTACGSKGIHALCKQAGSPQGDVVTTDNGYQVRILVSPPKGAATISIWSPSQESYVIVYRDDGMDSAQRFPDAWPDELPLIRSAS